MAMGKQYRRDEIVDPLLLLQPHITPERAVLQTKRAARAIEEILRTWECALMVDEGDIKVVNRALSEQDALAFEKIDP